MKLKVRKEELYKLYWEKEYSLEEIRKMFNCGRETIRNKFKKFGIKTRSRAEAASTKRFQKKCSARNIGRNNPHWKGGIIQNPYGYVYIKKPEHPRATKYGYVKRSYLVAEETLGRYLYANEITHHKNGIRNDDRPENIKVITRGEHTSFHNKNRKKYSAIKWLYRKDTNATT